MKVWFAWRRMVCGSVKMKHKLRFNRYFYLNRKGYRPLCDGRSGEGGVRQENVDVATCGRGIQMCSGVHVFRCSSVQVNKCSGVQVFMCAQNTKCIPSPRGATHPLTSTQHKKNSPIGATQRLIQKHQILSIVKCRNR